MRIAALILAAGGSTRFGQPKQLLPYRGQSLVRHVVTAALEAECQPVVVVVGREHTQIDATLQGLPVQLARNDAWECGLGSSIRLGVKALENCPAIAILACDQPHLSPALIRQLGAVQETTQKPIVASAYAETLGVPALFARSCFPALMSLPDGQGAKAIIAAHPEDVASVDFPDGAIDIDTPDDYRSLPDDS